MTATAPGSIGPPLGTRRGTLIAASAGVLYPVLGIASADSVFMTGMAMGAVAFLLELVFIAKLADLLGAVDGGSAWVRSLIVGLAAVNLALVLAFLATTATAVFWGSHGGLSTDGYLAVHGVAYGFYWLTLPVIALGSATVGLAIVATSLFPRWLGWLAIAIAIANGIGFFLPSEVWTVVSGLPIVWTLAMAVLVLMRADRYSDPVMAPALA